jgi:mRNA-degrading endonuclease HigB of HigAB toxin-antitoxin module
MKLISAFFTKKTPAVALVALMVMFTNALFASPNDIRRVFWNKFDATLKENNAVVLTWNVTEYNNKSFVVQHSVDGTEWETIALVQSHNSAESMTDYSYTHSNKLGGKQFYRLQDIDVDHGSTGYSPVRTLILKNDKQSVTIWPNPATDQILIANNDNSDMYTKARIFDLAGKVVTERKLNPNVNEIAVNELPSGIYIVKIENIKGASYSQKIVKQ